MAGAKSEVETRDPTPDYFKPVQQAGANVGQDILNTTFSDFSPFAQFARSFGSPLQNAGTSQAGALLGYNPEAQALAASSPAIAQLFAGGAGPQFSQVQNPFPQLGFQNQAQQVIAAQQPMFQENLQRGLGALANAAPSVTNSAFGLQAQDFTRGALRDFNLQNQQALYQGMQDQAQQQAATQQFLLGSQGLYQQGALGAGQLGQQGVGTGLNALTQMAANAGQNPFARAQQAAQLGSDIYTNQFVNPTLQMLLGALNYASPIPKQSIVNPGWLDSFLGAAGAGAAAYADRG